MQGDVRPEQEAPRPYLPAQVEQAVHRPLHPGEVEPHPGLRGEMAGGGQDLVAHGPGQHQAQAGPAGGQGGHRRGVEVRHLHRRPLHPGVLQLPGEHHRQPQRLQAVEAGLEGRVVQGVAVVGGGEAQRPRPRGQAVVLQATLEVLIPGGEEGIEGVDGEQALRGQGGQGL